MSTNEVIHLSRVCKKVYDGNHCYGILCENCPLNDDIATQILFDYIKKTNISKFKRKMFRYRTKIKGIMRTIFMPTFILKFGLLLKKCWLYIWNPIVKMARAWWKIWK